MLDTNPCKCYISIHKTIRLYKSVNALRVFEKISFTFAIILALCTRAALSKFGLRQLRCSWDSPNDKATIILWYRITCVLFLFTIFPFYRDLHVATTALFMAAVAAHVPHPIWKNPFPYCTCAWLRIAWSRFRLHHVVSIHFYIQPRMLCTSTCTPVPFALLMP